MISLRFLQAFQPRNALVQTPRSCSWRRGTTSPGSPGSGAAPAFTASNAEPLRSTQRFQPCPAAGKTSFPVRSPSLERVLGPGQRSAQGWRPSSGLGSQQHVSTCLGDLKVTSACRQPSRRRKIFQAQTQPSSSALSCCSLGCTPRGPLQMGLGGTLHRIGVPHGRLSPAWPGHGVGTGHGPARHGWGHPAELNLPRSWPSFIASPPCPLLLPLGADGRRRESGRSA